MRGNKKKATSINQNAEEMLMKIGAKLRKVRKDMGYDNGDDFSYDAGINRSQYGKYEAGSQDMRLSSLLKTINALGLTIEDFFGGGFGD